MIAKRGGSTKFQMSLCSANSNVGVIFLHRFSRNCTFSLCRGSWTGWLIHRIRFTEGLSTFINATYDIIAQRINNEAGCIASQHSILRDRMSILLGWPETQCSLWMCLIITSRKFYGVLFSDQFNWYTKRVSLAAVYKSTELFMLQDRSHDFEDTWTFLDRRLQNLGTFGKANRQVCWKLRQVCQITWRYVNTNWQVC